MLKTSYTTDFQSWGETGRNLISCPVEIFMRAYNAGRSYPRVQSSSFFSSEVSDLSEVPQQVSRCRESGSLRVHFSHVPLIWGSFQGNQLCSQTEKTVTADTRKRRYYWSGLRGNLIRAAGIVGCPSWLRMPQNRQREDSPNLQAASVQAAGRGQELCVFVSISPRLPS